MRYTINVVNKLKILNHSELSIFKDPNRFLTSIINPNVILIVLDFNYSTDDHRNFTYNLSVVHKRMLGTLCPEKGLIPKLFSLSDRIALLNYLNTAL